MTQEEGWTTLKSKLEHHRKDVLGKQIGEKEQKNFDFLQGTLLAVEGTLSLMQQIETAVKEATTAEEKIK